MGSRSCPPLFRTGVRLSPPTLIALPRIRNQEEGDHHDPRTSTTADMVCRTADGTPVVDGAASAVPGRPSDHGPGRPSPDLADAVDSDPPSRASCRQLA